MVIDNSELIYCKIWKKNCINAIVNILVAILMIAEDGVIV